MYITFTHSFVSRHYDVERILLGYIKSSAIDILKSGGFPQNKECVQKKSTKNLKRFSNRK